MRDRRVAVAAAFLVVLGLACVVLVACPGCSLPPRPAKTTISPARAIIIEIDTPPPAPVAPTGPVGLLYAAVAASATAYQPEVEAARRIVESAPPGSRVRIVVGESAGLATTDAQVVEGFNAEVPGIGASRQPDDSLSIAGGAVGFVARKLGVPTERAWFILGGGLLIAGGAAGWWYGAKRIGIGLIVAGGALLAVGWVVQNALAVLGVALLAGLGLLAWTMIRDRNGGQAEAALAAVAGAIDDTERHTPGLLDDLKARIEARMKAVGGGKWYFLDKTVDRARHRAGRG